MSVVGRLAGLGTWAIWLTLIACTLAPRPQTALAPAQDAMSPNLPPMSPDSDPNTFRTRPIEVQPPLRVAPQIQPTIVT